MKKLLPHIIFFFILSTVSFFTMGQACTPNNDTVPGITPDTLNVAFVGIPYQQVIYFRLPHDTSVIFGQYVIPIVIDSLLIDSVQGLPPSFNYACNTANCSVPGGSNGCVAIIGNADTSDIGIHPLKVFVTTYISDTAGAPAGFVPDTVTTYFLNVELATGISLYDPGINFSQVKVFPNPADDEMIISYYLPEPGLLSISIINSSGNICRSQSIEKKRGYSTESIDVKELKDGIYFILLKTAGNSFYSSFQVLKK